MNNACFRCRTSIPSGQTFCRTCQSSFSPEAETVDARPWWTGVALGSLVIVAYLGTFLVDTLTGLSFGSTVPGVLFLIGMVTYLAGLFLDDRAIRNRSDIEWSLSGWTVAALAFLSLFVIPLPIVGGVYLYLRRKHVGLSR